ncbi:MAG: 3-isopropylmalate dehydratase small subunit [Tepidiforma sp.]|jgi:3-isopropylmalate/(R)-2-methylmalate dehydratase small subunit|uniref:3-isopropylmalate dehydratase small subunit n=2 Tax=Tepidiforma TaxID=2682228 RepID=A0A2A9HDB5_TEPT2|nr:MULTISPECIES: 3-isopropylmalate dehydratase small subunit [Tepidiforma]PFG73974.1 3-isopropylmalate dehydratase small subunit [Tepidiforma thermophila]QFG02368.1 3-isopropylmalate dehydratase small subunit [Tepidiforma bonchosmolovskayae]GIW16218.1 MAG: 3-isopropylmalate dehydratase small subunit [Tepidiforma sp.]
MKKFETVRGRVIPLNRADVDTDQIISKEFLKRIERTGFGPFAFDEWRKDPDFVLNRPVYKGAPIMVTGPNFGCGSSREHAVWALDDMGLRVIIAPSFADIFRNNSSKVGLLTVTLPQEDCDWLIARAEELPEAELVVDLESQTVATADGTWQRRFEIDPFVKYCLLNGLDDIGLTLQLEDRIAAYEQRRPEWLPKTEALLAG